MSMIGEKVNAFDSDRTLLFMTGLAQLTFEYEDVRSVVGNFRSICDF